MADLIRHKRSLTPSAIPAPDQLVVGEIAVNAADGKLYTKLSSGLVVEIAGDKFTNPMTAAGDLMVGGEGGKPVRLGKGGPAQILGIDRGGNLAYINPQFVSVEYLVVAGGGSGGSATIASYGGSGGGAGGVRSGVALLQSGQIFPVVVGSGGAPVSGASGGNGNDGGNSSFNSLVSTGGGGGSGYPGAGGGRAGASRLRAAAAGCRRRAPARCAG